MTSIEAEVPKVLGDYGEIDISDKLEDTEVSRDSGLGDISEQSEDFDLSQYLEAAWQEEVGQTQFPPYSDNQCQQPSCPPAPPPEQQYSQDDVIAASPETEYSEDTQTTEDTEEDTEFGEERTEELYSCEETEETVPPGWELSCPDDGSSLTIRSPSGELYQSRREAFQAVCGQESSLQERAAMFDCLVYEGFCADERLPIGWIFQLTETEVNFLNNEGHFISSLSEAETHFKTHLSSERYEMFQQFLQSFGSDQSFLPAGWRLEDGLVKSETGVAFTSRVEALQSLVQSQGETEQTELVRAGLQLEGWAEHAWLPPLWRYRVVAARPQFVTREGLLLQSPEEAVSFLAANSPPYQVKHY